MNKTNLLSGLEGDEKILISHVLDLAEKCEKSGAVMYSPFLNPREERLSVSRCKGDYFVHSFGGFDDAERKMIAFCPCEEDEPYWPIIPIKIESGDGTVYSHRDYLGAVLSLGIKREKIGDIITEGDYALLFCDSAVADFICMNLDRVASGRVICIQCGADNIKVERKFEIQSVSVASLRLDCVLSAAMGGGREAACRLIERGLVQLNYDIAKSTSARVKSGDVISARGFGKMILETDCSTTRKGRIKADIKRFI